MHEAYLQLEDVDVAHRAEAALGLVARAVAHVPPDLSALHSSLARENTPK